MIEIRDLHKSFGEKSVLSGVSMDIPYGSITGLFGPSGCGKSTIANILCGLEMADSGEILMNGDILSDPSFYDRKNGLRIQVVWQQPHASLDPMQRVVKGLEELIRYHHLAEGKEGVQQMASDLLTSVGLAKEKGRHFPRQLSGGEAQRVSLARALALSPKLLIMDEATSMLDVSVQANIVELVRSKMKETGMGVLFISHDRELLDAIADRIYLFEDGRVSLR